MKTRVTRKSIREIYPYVIEVPYCNLQTLLRYEEPIAYCTRAEGWACDVYSFGDTAISTGYAPFGNRHANYETCRKYEQLADGKTKEERRELVTDFIRELTH